VDKKVICWWSGGITSAVACKEAIGIFGKEACRVIMMDTRNEDQDTYRFLKDCEKWYGISIERISAIDKRDDAEFVNVGADYGSIRDVWMRYNSLNVATGAICSTDLKRRVREKW
jgi:3'-phosphoadenosine 5'-phosphosulfate sulfotransferase (PAPS reductase)/FAD synthetase